ncbi:nucleosome assembly protein 1-like 1 isoform X2 [Uloborus diversus]|uniref:nucleosome assembly protein 1-like 1 isoform X2 n=1 Tax=Uloborus diversus TaxID=327109 RepID=UPI00240A4FB9|nr:nucleosome assembly protein 1-like 1 isoform X2 [Uloborus diversus]
MGDPKDIELSGDGTAVKSEAENTEAVEVEPNQPAHDTGDGVIKETDMLAAFKTTLGNMLNASATFLPKPVQRNVKALKKLQLTHVNLEVEFFKELHELEMKYEKKYLPLYEKRAAIVNGSVVPTDEECDFQSDSEKELELSNEIQKVKVEDDTDQKTDESADIKGIPEFWLTALKNAPTVADMIEEYDDPILKHLIDVKAYTHAEPMSFDLEFIFEPNDFFTNSTLTKHYELRCTPDPTDVFSFEGPEIVKCKGCVIDWKKGKNVTVKTIKKKQKHKARGAVRTVTKTVQNDSFFNFFNPPAAPEDEDQMDEETQNILSNDFEVGNLIKDRIIPNAVLFFTGENMIDDEFDEEDDDEDEDEYDEDEDDDDEEEGDNNQCLV